MFLQALQAVPEFINFSGVRRIYSEDLPAAFAVMVPDKTSPTLSLRVSDKRIVVQVSASATRREVSRSTADYLEPP